MFDELMKLATGRVDYFLGQNCVYTHKNGDISEFNAIFDRSREVYETEYELTNGVSETITASSESFTHRPSQGDTMVIGDNDYEIYDFDDHGAHYKLFLKRI